MHARHNNFWLVKSFRKSLLWTNLTVMFALPMSPFVENLMPSFVTEMATVSPMPLKSLQPRSAELRS